MIEAKSVVTFANFQTV